jgi:hypothetical protein
VLGIDRTRVVHRPVGQRGRAIGPRNPNTRTAWTVARPSGLGKLSRNRILEVRDLSRRGINRGLRMNKRQVERLVAWRPTRLTRGAAPVVLSVESCTARVDRARLLRAILLQGGELIEKFVEFLLQIREPFFVRVSFAINRVAPFDSGGGGPWFYC